MFCVGANHGAEVGDQCNRVRGNPLGNAPNGSPYNQVINGQSKFEGLPAGIRALQLPDNGFNASSYFLTVFGRPEGSTSLARTPGRWTLRILATLLL